MSEEEPSYTECIHDAIDALQEAQSHLNLGYWRCPGCGSIRYSNFDDKKRGDALSTAITRIQAADRKE